MNYYGKNIRISIFGESHGPYIGLTIDGLPAGVAINHDKIKALLLARRGLNDISTKRREPDEYQLISGTYRGLTTGTPVTIIIPNVDVDSSKYNEAEIIRPSHADLPNYYKFAGYNNPNGGGHSSGRITAPLVILGAISEQILINNCKDFRIINQISQIGYIQDDIWSANSATLLKDISFLENSSFPVYNQDKKRLMIDLIKQAADNNDSIGGIINTFVFGLPIGLGEPFFNSLESSLAHLMFSIPGIKGIDFGDGFDIVGLNGSTSIDYLSYDNDAINYGSNHHGGLNGGMTNGNYLKFRVAVRAPASINQLIPSINIKNKQNITVKSEGRHDPTIVHRIIPIIKSLTTYLILDYVIEGNKYEKINR